MLAVVALHGTAREGWLTPMWVLPPEEIATMLEQCESSFPAVSQEKPWVEK
jgi:hypothetical protein